MNQQCGTWCRLRMCRLRTRSRWPAALLLAQSDRWTRRGLEQGKIADIVVMNRELQVEMTMRRRREVYRKDT